MNDLIISTFGNQIFFEISNELMLFSKFKSKFYKNLDLFTLIRKQILSREKYLLVIVVNYLINNKAVLDQLFNGKPNKDFKSVDFSLQIEKLLS